MISKPLNLILVYILSIINFVIILAPFTAMALFLLKVKKYIFYRHIHDYSYQIDLVLVLNILIFLISAMMLLYLFLDFIFGFSVKSSLKDCVRYEKLKNFEFLQQIFDDVKKKFNRKDVKLYISKTSQINAFGVGCLGRNYIVLTHGLISHTLNNSKDRKEFLLMLRSIMGHEMSHLINKDYLPALLMITNQKASNFVARILEIMIKFPINFLGYFRVTSRFLTDCAIMIYNFVYSFLNFFNQKIIANIYEFIRRFLSRFVEYRCDRQSALAFGGYNMAMALALFGGDGYFTIFSTHPSTKSRIKKVMDLKRQENIVIKPLASSSISNYLALMFLIIICAVSAKNSGADEFIRHHINHLNFIKKF